MSVSQEISGCEALGQDLTLGSSLRVVELEQCGFLATVGQEAGVWLSISVHVVSRSLPVACLHGWLGSLPTWQAQDRWTAYTKSRGFKMNPHL